MDEKEGNRLSDAAITLGRMLFLDRKRNHMKSVSLHLFLVACGYDEFPHFCVSLDTRDTVLVDEAKALIPITWEGIPVFVIPDGPIRFASVERFEENWFDQNSYKNTLESLLRMSDADWIAGSTPERLAEGLYHEIRFIGAYSQEELQSVLEYIQEHKEELHQYVLHYFQNKNKSA